MRRNGKTRREIETELLAFERAERRVELARQLVLLARQVVLLIATVAAAVIAILCALHGAPWPPTASGG